jgi:uncharacterized protein (DUF885 family)
MAANASRSAGFSYGWLKPLMGMHLPYAVSHRSGPSASSADLMADLQPVSDLGDAEAYLEKLGAFGPAFAGAAEKLRADASIGCVVPTVLLEKAVAGMEAFTRTEPEGSPLVVEFVRKCERAGMPAAQVDRLRAVATARVGSIVYPAYAGLRSAALEQARAGKEAQGVWSLPQGDAFYAAVAATQGDTTLAPAEIHAFGLQEVARLRGELDTRLRKLGAPSGSLRDRLAAVRAGERAAIPGRRRWTGRAPARPGRCRPAGGGGATPHSAPAVDPDSLPRGQADASSPGVRLRRRLLSSIVRWRAGRLLRQPRGPDLARSRGASHPCRS